MQGCYTYEMQIILYSVYSCKIAIEETLRRVVEAEAETPALAVCRAEDEDNEEQHVLSSDDFIGVDIALSPDKEPR